MKRIMIIAAALAVLFLSGCAQESASIGIIGGADGPTKVFVAAAPFWWIPFALIAAATMAVIAVIVHVLRKRNEK